MPADPAAPTEPELLTAQDRPTATPGNMPAPDLDDPAPAPVARRTPAPLHEDTSLIEEVVRASQEREYLSVSPDIPYRWSPGDAVAEEKKSHPAPASRVRAAVTSDKHNHYMTGSVRFPRNRPTVGEVLKKVVRRTRT